MFFKFDSYNLAPSLGVVSTKRDAKFHAFVYMVAYKGNEIWCSDTCRRGIQADNLCKESRHITANTSHT